MAEKRTILVCSCEDTMPLDTAAIERGCRGANVETARQLCRAELERFAGRAAGGGASPSAAPRRRRCLPRWRAKSADHLCQRPRDRRLVERCRHGRAEDGGAAGRRRRADARGAVRHASTARAWSLIYGRDEAAIEAGELAQGSPRRHRADHQAARLAPPRVTEFPVVKGTIKSAKGHLGAFEIVVDDYAAAGAVVARRADLRRRRATARCRAATSCSICPAARRCFRPLICATAICAPIPTIRRRCCARCSRRATSSARSTSHATSPSTEDLCAHSRSKIVGCHRCLDLCPTGAITPAGDHVAIDAQICAGCGQCAAVCPTGAAAYALPPADALMRKLRALLLDLSRGRRRAIPSCCCMTKTTAPR